MERKLRKHQSTLVVAATGIMLFGLWSIVKTLMFAASIWKELVAYSIEMEITNKVVIGIMIGIIAVVLGSDLMMRLYIGLCAIAEGKGLKKRSLYLLLAGFLFFSHITSLPANLLAAHAVMDFALDTLITTVLDITSLYAMGDLIFSGIRVKQLRRQLEKQ